MEIVPLNEQVVVDVQVAPTDIDSVWVKRGSFLRA